MNIIDQIFWECIQIIEYLGNLSGLGYELTNILLFVVIEPLLIIIFLFLWIREKRKNIYLTQINQTAPKSRFIYFLWRVSRLLSIAALCFEILAVCSIFFDVFKFPTQSFIKSDLLQYFIMIIPIFILLTYNFLIFGKVSLWLRKP